MSATLIGLYVLLGLLLLSLNLRSLWPWPVKLFAILVTSGAYFLTYDAIHEIKGWPVPGPLPEEFAVHFIVVDEPDKAGGEDGKIFIWLSYLDDLGSPIGKPRVHEVLFSEALAQRSQEAIGVLMDGGRVNALVGAESDDEGSNPSRGQQSPRGTSADTDQPMIEFFEVGPVDLPPKADPSARPVPEGSQV